MHEHGLAKELWPQLQAIAEAKGFSKVYFIQMTVGMLHGVSAEFMEHSLQHAFEGSNFAGADVDITVVEPGEEYFPPHSTAKAVASGWELLVVRIEGEIK